MKLTALFAAFLLLFSAIAVSLPDYADAARMGGGRSFGSRPSMNSPASRPAPGRQDAAQPGAAMRSPGMMGGLFGGLLAGTLLGSLLGHGMGGGGGFLDIIILGILAYVAYRLFKRFRQNQGRQPAAAGGYGGQQGGASQMWNHLRQNFAPGSASPQVDVPAGFNVQEFLNGAKMAYTRMQSSWDRRDLADIAHFATPAVLDVLRNQMASDPNPGNTELVRVDASLVGMEKEGNEERAQVYFDVLMREYPNQTNPAQVREIWHFVRPDSNGNWKLDGIQQVQ